MPHAIRLKGQLAGLAVATMLLAVQCQTTSAKKIDGDRLLDPERLVDIRITLMPADWKELRDQARDFGAFFGGGMSTESPSTYFKADIWIDGVKAESVGVRKKGLFGSLDSQRPSLKIKFDEFVDQDPIKGLSRLTLNNNKQDGAQVSQLLTYKLFRDAGVHAPRSNLARVTVNDEYLGIYSNVESIKKPFLARAFGENGGNLYEGTLSDFHPKTIEKIEVKTNGESNDRSDITRLVNVLAAEGELNLDELGQIVELDNFMRYWAIEGMIRFWDGYASNQNNFYYYVNPKDKRGYFVPWGADWAFTKGGPFGSSNQGTTSIYAQSILANRLYHTEGVPARYRKTMLQLLDEVWNEKELIAEIDRVEKMISSHLHESQKGTKAAMGTMRAFINGRRKELLEELSDWPAEVPTSPRKPMYAVAVGKASGSFSTTWTERPPAEPTKTGEVKIQLELSEKVVEFKELGVQAQTFQFPGFGPGGARPGGGGPGGPANFKPPVNLVFTGTRASDNERVAIALFVDREAFEKVKDEPISVTGRLTEGSGGGFGFGFGGGANRSVNGKLWLTKSGLKSGDAVVGRVDLNIVEVHGGFFNQRRGPGRSRGGERRGARPSEQPRPKRPTKE